MKQTDSSKILYSPEVQAISDEIVASTPGLTSLRLEALTRLLESQAPSIAYRPVLEEALRDPIIVLHSSGSTGPPKPVVMTHGSFAVWDNDRNFPTIAGRKTYDLTTWDFGGSFKRIYDPFPPFHSAGFHSKIALPLFTESVPVYGPPSRPPNGALVVEIIERQKIRGCILPPSIAEQLLHESRGLDYFKQLDVFCYTGGPLSQAAGDAISQVTQICQSYGSTELGQVRQLFPKPEDWSYMEFHPDTKLDFQRFDEEIFELIVLADTETQQSSSLNFNLPGISEWRTKDLFKPHTTKSNLWRFYGRKDDIIVLSNGEKFNPIPLESQLQGLPHVSGAIIAGQNRFQPALLLEMSPFIDRSEEELIHDLWPSIKAANALLPRYGHIVHSLILIAKADKPFVRAGKGTVVRRLTEALYADEIENLYTRASQHDFVSSSPLTIKDSTPAEIRKLINLILRTTVDTEHLRDTDDFFRFGLDSLKVIEIVKLLRSSISSIRKGLCLLWLSPKTIYTNPSIDQLQRTVSTFLENGTVPKQTDRIAGMKEMLEKFAISPPSAQHFPMMMWNLDRLSIVLTGTTGALGARLLEIFSHHPKVSRICCLNRSSMAEQQHRRRFRSQKLDDEVSYNTQIHFMTVDFSKEGMGLTRHDQKTIQASDCIIHAAWKVDFNQDLSSFADNVRSIRTFMDWSIASPSRPRIVFISSVSSVGPWYPSLTTNGIPEAAIEDLAAAMPTGYGESKLVAERLLDKAANESGIPVSIIRVGQIVESASSGEALCTQQDATASMLKTSKAIGLIPSDLPPIDWVLNETVSNAVGDIVLHDMANPSRFPKYYHIVNPHPLPWPDALPTIQRFCGSNSRMIPISQWVESLKAYDTSDAEDIESKPALKLLSFFSLFASSGLPAGYQTEASRRASKAMAELQPVSLMDVKGWLEHCV